MSVARGFGINGKSYYTNVCKPIDINVSFVVDSTNQNGTGVSSLKSNGYAANIFMNTTMAAITANSVFASGDTQIVLTSISVPGLRVGAAVTDTTTGGNITAGTTVLAFNASTSTVTLSLPTAGASAVSPGDALSFQNVAASGSPDPSNGYMMAKFNNNFNKFINHYSSFQNVTTANTTAATVTGSPYVITAVGTTTLAQWQARGLPRGFTPTVGQSFIASTTGALGGTGTVGLPSASPIVKAEIMGDPNQEMNNSSIAVNAGAVLNMSLLAATAAGNTAFIPTAPADGTLVRMMFRFDGSSMTVDGL